MIVGKGYYLIKIIILLIQNLLYQSKYRKYTSYETNKETIYKTKEEEEKELLWKVKQYKMGMTAKIDQFEEKKILKILKDEKRSH